MPLGGTITREVLKRAGSDRIDFGLKQKGGPKTVHNTRVSLSPTKLLR
jgi:hypothetical protein